MSSIFKAEFVFIQAQRCAYYAANLHTQCDPSFLKLSFTENKNNNTNNVSGFSEEFSKGKNHRVNKVVTE